MRTKKLDKSLMFRTQMRIGNYAYVRDTLRDFYPNSKKRKQGWVFKELNNYWFQTIINIGFDDFEPIRLTDKIVERFSDYFEVVSSTKYIIPGTKITLEKVGGDWSVLLGDELIYRVDFVHQIQNYFCDITGVPLEADIKDLCPMELIEYNSGGKGKK